MDEDLKAYLDAKFAAIDARFVAIDVKFDRAAEAFAGEIGSLHTELQAIDARQRRDAGMTTTLMELVVKQTRWHQQSDNAIADLTARQSEFARRLDELGGKKA